MSPLGVTSYTINPIYAIKSELVSSKSNKDRGGIEIKRLDKSLVVMECDSKGWFSWGHQRNTMEI
jgi:hypothetical protein